MRSFFYILCALAGLVISFRPQRMGTCIGTMRDLSVAKSPIRGPSLVLREKDADEDKLESTPSIPEAVSNALRKINLPNILVGTFLGAFIVLVGLFGPIIVDNERNLPGGNLIVVDDDGGSDRSAEKREKRLRKESPRV